MRLSPTCATPGLIIKECQHHTGGAHAATIRHVGQVLPAKGAQACLGFAPDGVIGGDNGAVKALGHGQGAAGFIEEVFGNRLDRQMAGAAATGCAAHAVSDDEQLRIAAFIINALDGILIFFALEPDIGQVSSDHLVAHMTQGKATAYRRLVCV